MKNVVLKMPPFPTRMSIIWLTESGRIHPTTIATIHLRRYFLKVDWSC